MSALYSENLKRKDALVDLGVDGLILTNMIYFIMCDTFGSEYRSGSNGVFFRTLCYSTKGVQDNNWLSDYYKPSKD
jgi:hypothetical protein